MMYSKQEASRIRKDFWTSFGQYMRPLPGADGGSVNWLNYKTGIKHLYFRMDADKKQTAIGIELHHPEHELRLRYFEQLLQLKPVLEECTGEVWNWLPETLDEHGRQISRIGTETGPVNIFNRADWPAIISFLKPRMLALDTFWWQARDLFD